MALAVTGAPSNELLSTEDAKRHLRVYSGDLDDEIAQLVRVARDECEKDTGRTFRTSVTRTLTLSQWWPYGACDNWYADRYLRVCSIPEWRCLKLPWPPLLTVSGITYYDTDNASQTLGTGNYQVETSTDGGGKLYWTSTATIPAIYDRPDAVTITFTTGYASIDSTTAPLPPAALHAMKLKLTELWGAGTESELNAAVKAAERLLARVDWTGYA